MITGKIIMTFDDEHVEVDANVGISQGIADKCFIIDCLCRSLKLEGPERTFALAMVAAKMDDDDDKEETNDESRCIGDQDVQEL